MIWCTVSRVRDRSTEEGRKQINGLYLSWGAFVIVLVMFRILFCNSLKNHLQPGAPDFPGSHPDQIAQTSIPRLNISPRAQAREGGCGHGHGRHRKCGTRTTGHRWPPSRTAHTPVFLPRSSRQVLVEGRPRAHGPSSRRRRQISDEAIHPYSFWYSLTDQYESRFSVNGSRPR